MRDPNAYQFFFQGPFDGRAPRRLGTGAPTAPKLDGGQYCGRCGFPHGGTHGADDNSPRQSGHSPAATTGVFKLK